MPGVLGTAAGGVRILGIFLVGIFVATVIAPGLLGGITGLFGVWLSTDVVAVASIIGALLVMGWLA